MWDRIKKILQKQGGKCIILEENEAYVIMKLEDYDKILDDSQSSEIEKVNHDIDRLKAEEEIAEPEEKEAVKVEDLPF